MGGAYWVTIQHLLEAGPGKAACIAPLPDTSLVDARNPRAAKLLKEVCTPSEADNGGATFYSRAGADEAFNTLDTIGRTVNNSEVNVSSSATVATRPMHTGRRPAHAVRHDARLGEARVHGCVVASFCVGRASLILVARVCAFDERSNEISARGCKHTYTREPV